ncbi:MAG: hypothetical protein Q8S46_05225 [Methylotenera sp.]|nr:hypothetical protein [Methylotenera sp.]MDP1958420.1 hypothetical protein [Methylotenera sp.]MDP3206710.1 hypothetical protein [Methylotenera sp.]MDP3303537.1 hypothetical protein [Methylotenera sp.]MDP3942495.1 hypothetical protein [Methylotenera sp.]
MVKIDDKYLSDDGHGGILFTSKEEAYLFKTFDEAQDTASLTTKEGWRIEEVEFMLSLSGL